MAKQLCFPGGSVVKNPPANAGNAGSIPGSGRSPGVGNGKPFADQPIWWTTGHGVTKSQTCLSTHTHIHVHGYL